jgi:tetratricopeptide (TPR) repeat protein
MLTRLRALLARVVGGTLPSTGDPMEPLASPAAPEPAPQPTVLVADMVPTAPAAVARGSARDARASRLDLARAGELVAAGKVERAITTLEASLRDYPDEEVATTLEELRTIRRARKRLQRRSNDAQAHFDLGRALFAQERGSEALPHLEIACRLRPAWLDAHLLRAYELHWQSRWREAEAAYQAALTLDPGHVVARRGLTAVRVCQPPDALLANYAPPGHHDAVPLH